MTLFKTLMAAVAGLFLAHAAIAQTDDMHHPEGMHIHDAYARLSASSGAVFFLVHNNSDQDDRLIGARTDLAERTELHTHVEGADGVMQMREIDGGVPLPAGEVHAFERGGDHVMLMGLTRALQDGESFDLTLVFEQAGEVTLTVVIDSARKPGTMIDHGDHSAHGAHAGHHHDHGTTKTSP